MQVIMRQTLEGENLCEFKFVVLGLNKCFLHVGLGEVITKCQVYYYTSMRMPLLWFANNQWKFSQWLSYIPQVCEHFPLHNHAQIYSHNIYPDPLTAMQVVNNNELLKSKIQYCNTAMLVVNNNQLINTIHTVSYTNL